MQSAFGVDHGEISKSVASGVGQIQRMSTRTVARTGQHPQMALRARTAQRELGAQSQRSANKLRGQQQKKFVDENWNKGNLNYETPKSPLKNMPKYGTK